MRKVPVLLPEAVGTTYNIDPPSNVASLYSRLKFDKWDALFPAQLPFKFGKAAIARSVELHLMDSVNPALKEQHTRLVEAAAKGECKC